MMKAVAIGVGVLLLAGCGGSAPEQQNAAVVADAGTVAPAAAVDGNIPASFQGRWGLVPADCTSTNGDNKGLMTVEPDRLTFYESRATITKLDVRSPTELRAALAFTGEGQTWTQEMPLVLEDGGTVLTRIADGQTLRYTRCGA